MGLGPILERHNAFQWDLAADAAAAADACRLVCAYPYTIAPQQFMLITVEEEHTIQTEFVCLFVCFLPSHRITHVFDLDVKTVEILTDLNLR